MLPDVPSTRSACGRTQRSKGGQFHENGAVVAARTPSCGTVQCSPLPVGCVCCAQARFVQFGAEHGPSVLAAAASQKRYEGAEGALHPPGASVTAMRHAGCRSKRSVFSVTANSQACISHAQLRIPHDCHVDNGPRLIWLPRSLNL